MQQQHVFKPESEGFSLPRETMDKELAGVEVDGTQLDKLSKRMIQPTDLAEQSHVKPSTSRDNLMREGSSTTDDASLVIDITDGECCTPTTPERRVCVELGSFKKFEVFEWPGDRYKDMEVDIRQWTPTLSGECIGSKRGVNMPLKRYKVLRDNVGKLSEALADVKGGKDVNVMIHLGGNMHASIQSPYQGINIRQWFRYQNMNQDKGELKPGRGIFLKSGEWTEFCKVNSCLDELVPELSETIYCMDQTDHMNQLGGIACMECNPDQDYYEYL